VYLNQSKTFCFYILAVAKVYLLTVMCFRQV
jgi:hypothetical protein